MKVLLKAATIYSPASTYHLQQHHILVENGIITYIGDTEQEAEKIIEAEGLCVSGGWIDMYAYVGEPGFEHKEDIQSIAAAAAKGGFTEVLCLPNTSPVIQTKGAINYISSHTTGLPVTLHPIAAATIDTDGKDLTEMIDLYQAGAVAFSDGIKPLQSADVILKALQYVQLFGGLLMNKPENTRLSENGQMHEGIISTQLGMKGIPALAEEITVIRDLQLLAYAGGKMHFSLVSTAATIEAIRKGKKQGLQVTCDVASYQLAFTDETIVPFDTNYKVSPPFRSNVDNEAIVKGLADGTIDALVSGHMPHDTESKKLEFDLADFGIINLETAFAVANTTLKGALALEQLVDKFVTGPRTVLGFDIPSIEVGRQANLTLFQPEANWTPSENDTQSKGRNTPFYGKELKGRVLGIIHKGQVVLH